MEVIINFGALVLLLFCSIGFYILWFEVNNATLIMKILITIFLLICVAGAILFCITQGEI